MGPVEVTYEQAMVSRSCILVQILSEPDGAGAVEVEIVEIEEDASDLFSTHDVIVSARRMLRPAAMDLAKKCAFERAVRVVAFCERANLH